MRKHKNKLTKKTSMKNFFKVASVAIITLFTSCNSSAQKKTIIR